MARGYWLLKSDPDTFGWPDLLASPKKSTCWVWVRNYKARNSLRDDFRKGDRALFYHSQTDKAVVGTAEVVRAGYPDPTQFDRRSAGFDPKSAPDDPRWFAVDIRAEHELDRAVTLEDMRGRPELADLGLLRRGNRLSVMPVTAEEYRAIVRVGRGRG